VPLSLLWNGIGVHFFSDNFSLRLFCSRSYPWEWTYYRCYRPYYRVHQRYYVYWPYYWYSWGYPYYGWHPYHTYRWQYAWGPYYCVAWPILWCYYYEPWYSAYADYDWLWEYKSPGEDDADIAAEPYYDLDAPYEDEEYPTDIGDYVYSTSGAEENLAGPTGSDSFVRFNFGG